MKSLLSSMRGAKLGMAGLALLALLEWRGLWRDAAPALEEQDFTALQAALDEASKEAPVALLLADPWLGPRYRLEMPQQRSLQQWGRPDLHALPRVGIASLRGFGDQREQILNELEEANKKAPRRVSTAEYGAFRLEIFDTGARPPRDDLLDRFDELEVRVEDQLCGGTNIDLPARGAWRCKKGELRLAMAEVDYEARRCAALRLDPGSTMELRLPMAPGLWRGHLGLPDFNARLRGEAPYAVEFYVDEQRRGSLLATDAAGWRAFELEVPETAPRAELRIEIRSVDDRRWDGQRAGRRELCLEMRSLEPSLGSSVGEEASP